MTKTITQINEIPGEEGKITHTISYNLDLDGHPYGCKVKRVQEIGKYGSGHDDFDIPDSELESIVQQSGTGLNVDKIVDQAIFNYLSQEIQKKVGKWGFFGDIDELHPQLAHYAAKTCIPKETVDTLIEKVIHSGFNPGLELIIKRKQESREWRKKKERKLGRNDYRSELKWIENIAKYAFHIPGGEEKVAIIKKEVEEDIRQEAARYFESDLEHAATLLGKEKDPDATNLFQVVDTFAQYICDLQLFADYVPNGWQKMAELHQTSLNRTIALAKDAFTHDNKKETAQRIGESRSFLYWFEDSYKDRQPEFPTTVMRESIQQLEQKIEQKYRRPWYDLLED